MTAIYLLAPVVMSILIGTLFVMLLTRHGFWVDHQLYWQIALGTGVGLGITSILYFLWRAWAGPVSMGYFILELVLVIILTYFTRRIHLPPDPSEPEPFQAMRRSNWEKIILSGFLLSILIGMVTFDFASIRNPHGNWDAWAIWNLSARFLFRNGNDFSSTFSELLFHADYPLLLPAGVARLWSFVGRESRISAPIIAFQFALGGLSILVAAVYIFRQRLYALMAGMGLLSASAYIVHSPSQGADIPISFFFLATFILYQLYYRTKAKNYLTLAGITAGLSAWTKNEGALFVLVLPVA
jgi:hypothetical protein